MRASLSRLSATSSALAGVARDDFEAIGEVHFKAALATVRPSVAGAELGAYVAWDGTYGTKPSAQSIELMHSMRGRNAADRDAAAAAAGGGGAAWGAGTAIDE